MAKSNATNEANTISGYEIFMLFWQNKIYAIAIFVACVAVGLIFALMMPKQYNYYQTVKLSYYLKNNTSLVPIVDAKEAIDTLNQVIIPGVLNKYMQKNQSISEFAKIQAKRLGNATDLLQITDDVSPKYKNEFKSLSMAIVKAYQQHEAVKIQLWKNDMSRMLNDVAVKYKSNQASLKLVQAQLQNVTQQYDDVRQLFLKNTGKLKKAKYQVADNHAVDLIRNQFLGSEIAQYKDLLYQRLSPALRDFQAKILQLNNQQSNLLREKALLATSLNSLQTTQLSESVIRSIRPISTSSKQILLLAIFLGLIFAIAGSLLAAFIKSVLKLRA